MQEDARSSLVSGAMVPRRNVLLVVNQSKKDGASPKIRDSCLRVKIRKTSNVEGYRLLNVNILEDMVASLSCSRMF